MNWNNRLFAFLGLDNATKAEKLALAKSIGTSLRELEYWNDNNLIPLSPYLEEILRLTEKTLLELKITMGLIDHALIAELSCNAREISNLVHKSSLRAQKKKKKLSSPVYETDLGLLYNTDCVSLAKQLENESVDLIFADPPFNLNKLYPSKIDDKLKEFEYLKWSEEWLYQCCRILKPGGSLFIWNLPKWNLHYGNYLKNMLTFKHWIACDIKFSLPIQGRLYPSHYSLLYFTKGSKSKTFKPDRLPMAVCPHCLADLVDYGGYKDKMNPLGVNLSDVWLDIPPVRHKNIKRRKDANELSIKLLDRVIEMCTEENDLVFDPFGGSGTTYIVAELKKRKWIGVEIGPVEDIINRFSLIKEEAELLAKYRKSLNSLFPEKVYKARLKRNLWVNDFYPSKKHNNEEDLQTTLF